MRWRQLHFNYLAEKKVEGSHSFLRPMVCHSGRHDRLAGPGDGPNRKTCDFFSDLLCLSYSREVVSIKSSAIGGAVNFVTVTWCLLFPLSQLTRP
jgi:hypothetical protein